MIEGVKIKKLIVRKDDPDLDQPGIKPGILMEVLRDDDGLLKKFGQTTFTVANLGAIKAFHYHEKQDDLWFVATGKAMVVLFDTKKNSPTYKKTQVLYAGENDYKLIVIPAGVAHGYKVLSEDPVMLFYHTTEHYDNDDLDEKRIAYNDTEINFNWSQ